MEALAVLLIIGLGNPGKEYAGTRHNAGFLAIDEIVDRYGFSGPQAKFHGEFFQGEIDGTKVFALKPQTFMNKSGISVSEAARFYKVPVENVIVLYDELDLVPGRIRVKQGGGSGGHNGIKSIDSHFGKDYWRVRIGIGHPGDKNQVSSYVLSKFTNKEKQIFDETIDAAAEAFPLLAEGESEKFMTKVALQLQEEK
jgi:PTH1 family peptidyl-tRNA hydrolase